MDSKNVVFSKTILVQVLGMIAATLALPELQELIGKSSPELLAYIVSIQSGITILLRIFSANKKLTFFPTKDK